MKRVIINVVSVLWTFFRLVFTKLYMGKRLHFYFIERFSPNVSLEFNRKSRVWLGKKIRLHGNCKIKVREGANLEIQDGAKMNHNCVIACRDKIVIGKGTEFGPAVFLYDHDHKHNPETGKNDGYNTSPIIIGNNCWIGANTLILKGAVLGNNCVIAAGSVVTGSVPESAVFIQKRETTILLYNKKNK